MASARPKIYFLAFSEVVSQLDLICTTSPVRRSILWNVFGDGVPRQSCRVYSIAVAAMIQASRMSALLCCRVMVCLLVVILPS